jgi:hypothetical protein
MRCAIDRSLQSGSGKDLAPPGIAHSMPVACRRKRPTGGGSYCEASCRVAERDEIAAERKVLWWTIPIAKLKGRRNPTRTEL